MSSTDFRPKHRDIFFRLRDEIAAGRYRGERRLPTEAELVARFGVSRPTVGRALRELQIEGLIERRAISAVPPWVEYSLTPKGSELRVAISGIDRWADRWAAPTQ